MSGKSNVKEQKAGYARFTYMASAEWKEKINRHHCEILFPLLDAEMPAPRKICEIGFNEGFLLRKMQAKFPGAEFFGTEVRQEAADNIGEKNFSILMTDDETIPSDEQFDLIYGSSVLHHFSEPYAFLEKAYKKLRGGVIVFICEPHLFNLPCIGYSTARRLWHLEKNLLKLTRKKLQAHVRSLSPLSRVWYDNASYFCPFPAVKKPYEKLGLTKFPLLSELQIFIKKP